MISQDRPTDPLIFEGEISARYIGPTHMPRPDATPIKNLKLVFSMVIRMILRARIATYLPIKSGETELLSPMKAVPDAMRIADIR